MANNTDLMVEITGNRKSSSLESTRKRFEGFDLEPLFGEVTLERSDFLKTSEEKQWFVAKPKGDAGMKPWDLAHKALQDNWENGFDYVEPDLEVASEFSSQDSYPVSPPPPTAPNDPLVCYLDNEYITFWGNVGDDEPAWHLAKNRMLNLPIRTQDPGEGRRIRIGHLDSGFDPRHVAKPMFILENLQHSFVKGDSNPNLAHDNADSGFIKQPGHGTGTITILAGSKVKFLNPTTGEVVFDGYYGGAPFAEVIPIRIANTVAHVIKKNLSGFAKGLKYAADNDCQVVTMSMGGMINKVAAELVNKAYERGVFIVTAAGNNFAGLPVLQTVFPACFKRVVSAHGITKYDEPYYREDLSQLRFKMQGNFGPDEVMKYGLAAYSPNLAWANLSTLDDVIGTNSFRRTGGGTSSVTPQIAAAASLWLQKYQDEIRDFLPWQRVEAVRHALFSSARPAERRFFGNGILDAEAALEVRPVRVANMTPVDKLRFPWLQVLFGYRYTGDDRKEEAKMAMYETEIQQLVYSDKNVAAQVENAIEDEDLDSSISLKSDKDLADAIVNSPMASESLKAKMEGMLQK